MKDKESKHEEIESSLTLGGVVIIKGNNVVVYYESIKRDLKDKTYMSVGVMKD